MRNLADLGEPQEFEVTLPYGKIACIKWGPEDGPRFLALHGLMDNLATFFPLVNYLPDNIHLVTIDLVGHGFSSCLPIGAKYSRLQLVTCFKRIVLALGWNRFSLLGHSLGGVIASLYAGIFPDEVESLVLLDVVYPGTRILMEYTLEKSINSLFIEEQNLLKPFVYSKEEAFHRFRRARPGFPPLNSAPIQVILQRSLMKVGDDKVVFRHDPRLRAAIYGIEELRSREQFFDLIHSIKCKTLIILAKRMSLTLHEPELQKETIDILTNNLKEKFQLAEIDSSHYVHLEKSEEVGKIITEFISNQNIGQMQKSKL